MSRLILLAFGLLLCASPALAQARARVVDQSAPIRPEPSTSVAPLRVASINSSLVVVSDPGGDWLLVQFRDPQAGIRTGYVLKRQVVVEGDIPVDVSVPANTPAAAQQRFSPPPSLADAQQPGALPPPLGTPALERSGFWFSGGMGFGALTCDFCEGYANGFSGGLSGGGTVNQHLLVGIGTTGWYRNFNGVWLNAGTFDGRIRYYPVARSGFHVNAGAGIGSVSIGVGRTSINETGFGLMYGLGWDVRVGRNVSLTPFWNGSGIAISDTVIAFGQLGLAVTVH